MRACDTYRDLGLGEEVSATGAVVGQMEEDFDHIPKEGIVE
jgi:hypothetical protein